ncbi:MAG TPA: Sec-independent protein translocase protein TatB [Rhodanobacter sp.]|nr:Sec-independent protein translocase protein TatB [Rhodanobacter sp.]
MIEISLGKLVLLALIALIVLGPEKLPGAARTAGALLRRVRSGWDNVRAEVERELEIEQIKRTAREAAARAEAAQNELKDGVLQVHEPLSKAVAEVAVLVKPEPAVAAETTIPDDGPAATVPSESMQTELPLGEPLSKPARNPAHDDA